MIAVEAEVLSKAPDGHRTVRAFIVSDTTPETIPTSGAGVRGLMDTDVFAPFSILYVTADVEKKLYVADESGRFVAQ